MKSGSIDNKDLIDLLSLKIMELRNILAYQDYFINEYDEKVFLQTSYLIYKIVKNNREKFSKDEIEDLKLLSRILKKTAMLARNSYGAPRTCSAKSFFGEMGWLDEFNLALDLLCVSMTRDFCIVQFDLRNYRYTDFIMNVVRFLERLVNYFRKKLDYVEY
ncbi:MAG: hypothetical protein QXJ64_06290 [Thermosphaera sp.]